MALRPSLSLLVLALTAAVAAPSVAQSPKEDERFRAVTSPSPHRTVSVDIPLASGDEAGHWIEWLVRTQAGRPLLASWSVSGVTEPEEFYGHFFGHGVEPESGEDIIYQRRSGLFSHSAVTPPYDGLHGWYFKNDSAGAVVVHLTLSGYFDLVSAEELAAIQAAEAQ